MNSATRSQIIAAKEKLNRMAEEAREAEERKVAREHWEKTQEEERAQEAAKLVFHKRQAEHLTQKEKTGLEAKAKEEERHLRLHNRNVKQVLSQVAKAGKLGGDAVDVDDDEDPVEESSTEESSGENQHENQHQSLDPHEKGKELTEKETPVEAQKTTRRKFLRKSLALVYPT